MQGCESGVPLYEGFAKITGIVRVCQQTYQETRLVPLSKPILCLSQLQYNALELSFQRLTAAQLVIITRVALSAREGWRIGLDYEIIRHRQSDHPEQDPAAALPDKDKSALLSCCYLQRFTALQRVEIHNSCSGPYSAETEDWIRAGVRFCSGKHDLKVVFRPGLFGT